MRSPALAFSVGRSNYLARSGTRAGVPKRGEGRAGLLPLLPLFGWRLILGPLWTGRWRGGSRYPRRRGGRRCCDDRGLLRATPKSNKRDEGDDNEECQANRNFGREKSPDRGGRFADDEGQDLAGGLSERIPRRDIDVVRSGLRGEAAERSRDPGRAARGRPE